MPNALRARTSAHPQRKSTSQTVGVAPLKITFPKAPTALQTAERPPRLRRNWAEDLAPLKEHPGVWAMVGEFIRGTAGSLRKNRKLRSFTFFERCFPSKREAQLWARFQK